MIALLFGEEAVREVWENCAAVNGPNMWEALDEMFIAHGMDFDMGFMEYGMWRYFTGPNYSDAYNLWDPDLGLPASGPAVLPYNNHNSLPPPATREAIPRKQGASPGSG